MIPIALSAVIRVVLGVCLASAAFAQESSTLKKDYLLPEISVLGPSWGKTSVNQFVPTLSEISGKRLDRKKQSTLGETLSREAGISSSYFGPNASRPVIRGLDGERVRILQNGIGTMDASGTSPDHAVSADPFLTNRIEVVRGSASLLYGNSAVGGVVNMSNHRILEELPEAPRVVLNSQYSSVDSGRNGGFVLESKVQRFAFHLDGVMRGTNNYAIPNPVTAGDKSEVANSGSKSWEGALGGSMIFDSGFAGASFSSFNTLYGTVAQPNVKIDLARQRAEVASEIKGQGFIQSTRVKGGYSHYKHQELEGSLVGTTFTNRGSEVRVDLKHRPIAGLEGVLGTQGQYSDFTAQGTEAFLPTTVSTSMAAFAYEEIKLGKWTPSFGARLERNSVKSMDSSRFGLGITKISTPISLSGGVLVQLSSAYSLGMNTTYSQRSPNYQELFANGAHVGTGIYEVGSQILPYEVGRAVEFSLREKTDSSEGRISVYAQDFQNFIALLPSGATDAASGLSIYDYKPVHARFYGAELEYRRELPYRVGPGFFEMDLKLDFVRAVNLSNHANLPRITPVRETVGVDYVTNWGRANIEGQHSHRQTLNAPGETMTAGYVQVNAGIDVPLNTFLGVVQLKAKVDNLFNSENRNHVSFLKDKAPLPGRNFVVSLNCSF